MSLTTFESLYERAGQRRSPVPVVAAGGADPTVLSALEQARSRGWVQPFVTGDPEHLAAVAKSQQVDLSRFTVVPDQNATARGAVELVRTGDARLLMKGQISTPDLMGAVLDREHGLRTGQTICQMVLMQIERDRRSFLMTDTGITVQPTLDQKRELIRYCIQTARRLGSEKPRVAVVSATEKAMPALPDSLEARALAEEGGRGDFGDCRLAGPLSFDLAYACDAAEKKQTLGEVAGRAEALVFPDLLSANLTVKAIMYTADCRFGGVLLGAACPVVFMSRADTVQTRLNSLALALQLLGE